MTHKIIASIHTFYHIPVKALCSMLAVMGLISASAQQIDTLKSDTTQEYITKQDTTKENIATVDSTLDTVSADSIRREQAKQEAIRQEKIRQDSIRARTSFVPTGIRLGTDLVSWIRMALPDGFTGWEVNADIDFNKFLLSGEFGKWEKTISSAAQNYANQGYYFRVGVDVVFFSKQRNKNIFFLGGRYGRSTFDEHLNYTFEDKSFGRITKTINSSEIEASWVEITTGFRIKLWKGLWMGYTVRLKMAPNVNASEQLQPYDIPGFGLLTRIPGWGFNYQLFWRIGFRR